MTRLIEVEHISFSYPESKQPALEDVSFAIERGEHVAIIGGNGSGKSTLARHLNALLMPSRGTVRIDGQSTTDSANLKEIRRKIGMVFQHPENQIIGATVEEDIAFGLENLAVPTNKILHNVDAILDVVNLGDYRKQPSHMLSGGQIQKLCLASVLVMSPACVIFDEATAMLDPQSRQRIYDAIDSLQDEGITVITITHDMEEAAMADRLLVMHEGHLMADMSPKAFFADEGAVDEALVSLPPITAIGNAFAKQWGLKMAPVLTDAEFAALVNSHPKPTIQKNLSSSGRIQHFADEKKAILIEHLGYAYFPDTALERKIFDDFSMSIDEKTIHGLLGATGTGKTTLMQHLNGLILPQKGNVKVFGVDTQKEETDLKALRQEVGFVFQYTSHQLFENYVGDEIAFGLRAFGVTNGIRDRVAKAMDLVGLDFDQFVNRQTFSLSGGEQKKVALASILVLEPKLLLFDEPTVGLDPASQASLMAMLVNYRTQEDKTIMLSSHNTNLMAEFADAATVIGTKQDAYSDTIGSFFEDSSRIQSFGLNVPTSVRAKQMLNEAGWNLPADLTRERDVIEVIEEARK